VTGGPKNYAYQVEKKGVVETECKIRGIILNYKNAMKINFDTVKNMVINSVNGDHETIVVEDNFKITRDNTNKKLLTIHQDKEYRIVFDKRVIRKEDMVSFPYGY
jgi:hypothetical protein